MEKYILTPQEEGEIQKRGFLIKKINIPFTPFFYGIILRSLYRIFFLALLIIPISGYLYSVNKDFFPYIIFSIYIPIVICVVIIINEWFLYSQYQYGYFYEDKKNKCWRGIIGGTDNDEKLMMDRKILFPQKVSSSQSLVYELYILPLQQFLSSPVAEQLLVFLVSSIYLAYWKWISGDSLHDQFFIIFWTFILVLGFVSMVDSKGYNIYLKLGILCEKVQNLTLQLGSLSGQIQNAFGDTLNLGSWKSNFIELAQLLSYILHTIPDIEYQEKYIIAKGNLFDSTKYINSLRQDILTPLVSLKSFLEEKRQQLLGSQQELMRVIVGESSELTGNTKLATIRGTELLTELDTSIAQLDEMIAKMG